MDSRGAIALGEPRSSRRMNRLPRRVSSFSPSGASGDVGSAMANGECGCWRYSEHIHLRETMRGKRGRRHNVEPLVAEQLQERASDAGADG